MIVLYINQQCSLWLSFVSEQIVDEEHDNDSSNELLFDSTAQIDVPQQYIGIDSLETSDFEQPATLINKSQSNENTTIININIIN